MLGNPQEVSLIVYYSPVLSLCLDLMWDMINWPQAYKMMHV